MFNIKMSIWIKNLLNYWDIPGFHSQILDEKICLQSRITLGHLQIASKLLKHFGWFYMDLEDKHLPYFHLIQQYIMYFYDLGKDSECEKTEVKLDCLGGEVLDEADD